MIKKKTLMTLSTAFLLGGLVGCAQDNEALDTRYNDTTQPIGYYTNNDDSRGFGWGMGDYTTRYTNQERGDTDRYMNRGMRNNATPQAGEYKRKDVNYYGQMNNSLDGRANKSYYNNYNGKMAESISRTVSEMNNIDDCRAVVTRDTVLVAVDTNDNNVKDVENKVRAKVEQMANGKNVRVVTDERMYDRVTNIDNRLRDGAGMREVRSDLRGVMDDLGNAITRPFENNAR
ncbi:YhcN/YlaJ family sporulation lipoprotein [Bacillus tianshenii]|nr:YhcN/YlaJ family sporulation lipoprotein [Bacillus tianshenii]